MDCITPTQLFEKYPISDKVSEFIKYSRKQIVDILENRDKRILLIVGPCSIHNYDQAIEYAISLSKIVQNHKDSLMIVMRTYFEKPRTSVGWKGFVYDPSLNDKQDINFGIQLSFKLLMEINKLGIPCGTEFLDPLTHNYLAPLISWGCIGARTTESQPHRQIASGLSCPIGFKNGTTGSIKIAVDAIIATQVGHSYLDINGDGKVEVRETLGNPNCHIVLRGGWDGPIIKPNYYIEDLQKVSQLLQYSGLNRSILIDCSHGNSKKNHNNQPHVAHYIADQISRGNMDIIGLMIESHINSGRQDFDWTKDKVEDLKHGVSITDACIDLATTESVIEELSIAVKNRKEWFDS
tara:strand:- start:2261 stop:3313 length:1053 start_codon:yes stop_codon:yes gene_type:complete